MNGPHGTPLTVLKFGSSVLRGDADLPAAVHEIYRQVRRGHHVVAVVSALGDTTDALLARARALGPAPAAEVLAVDFFDALAGAQPAGDLHDRNDGCAGALCDLSGVADMVAVPMRDQDVVRRHAIG